MPSKRKEGEFFARAHKFFLTYPRCDLEREAVLKKLKTKGPIRAYVICREEHDDEDFDDDRNIGVHIHAIVHYVGRVQVTARSLDIGDFHPHIEVVKSWPKAKAYCKKQDKAYISLFNAEDFDDENPRNFIKNSLEHAYFKSYHEVKSFPDVKWPIPLPDGQPFKPQGKKRHLWIWGPASAGKSFWAEEVFAGKRIYGRTHTENPYELYKGETVIMYDDDHVPEWKEITNVTDNHWKPLNHVYSRSRYAPCLWVRNLPLVMIVINNDPPNYPHMDAFNERFTVIYQDTWFDDEIMKLYNDDE